MTEKTICYERPKGGEDVLLNCPFCGSAEIVYEQYKHTAGKRWRVICMGCIAMIDPGYVRNKYTVREMWNRRTGGADNG